MHKWEHDLVLGFEGLFEYYLDPIHQQLKNIENMIKDMETQSMRNTDAILRSLASGKTTEIQYLRDLVTRVGGQADGCSEEPISDIPHDPESVRTYPRIVNAMLNKIIDPEKGNG